MLSSQCAFRAQCTTRATGSCVLQVADLEDYLLNTVVPSAATLASTTIISAVESGVDGEAVTSSLMPVEEQRAVASVQSAHEGEGRRDASVDGGKQGPLDALGVDELD